MFKSYKDLCEKIYPDDFKVVENDEPCMQIWFEEGPNPNDEVSFQVVLELVVFDNLFHLRKNFPQAYF